VPAIDDSWTLVTLPLVPTAIVAVIFETLRNGSSLSARS
jgi:hypothetical protein